MNKIILIGLLLSLNVQRCQTNSNELELEPDEISYIEILIRSRLVRTNTSTPTIEDFMLYHHEQFTVKNSVFNSKLVEQLSGLQPVPEEWGEFRISNLRIICEIHFQDGSQQNLLIDSHNYSKFNDQFYIESPDLIKTIYTVFAKRHRLNNF